MTRNATTFHRQAVKHHAALLESARLKEQWLRLLIDVVDKLKQKNEMQVLFRSCLLMSVLFSFDLLAADIPTVNVVVTVVQTNTPPMPPHPKVTALAEQMRLAAQIARSKVAPWTQRLIVTSVEEKAATRSDEDGPPVFSTNYLVTVVPITDDTNAPVTWGTTKNKSIRFYTTSPTKKGDEFELFPVRLPLMPQEGPRE